MRLIYFTLSRKSFTRARIEHSVADVTCSQF